jgi:hypothetical protein
MANMARMMDRGRAVADALVWGALEMMAGTNRSRHNVPLTGSKQPEKGQA